jgi:hypothetical protein
MESANWTLSSATARIANFGRLRSPVTCGGEITERTLGGGETRVWTTDAARSQIETIAHSSMQFRAHGDRDLRVLVELLARFGLIHLGGFSAIENSLGVVDLCVFIISTLDVEIVGHAGVLTMPTHDYGAALHPFAGVVLSGFLFTAVTSIVAIFDRSSVLPSALLNSSLLITICCGPCPLILFAYEKFPRSSALLRKRLPALNRSDHLFPCGSIVKMSATRRLRYNGRKHAL